MSQGWIKLHRQLIKNPIWFEEPFSKGQAWVDLVLNANHKDGRFFVRGIEIPILRGQLGWSEVTMAKRWKWSIMKVRRYLKRLENDTQVRQQKLFKITTVITIINYEKYQGDTTDETTNETTDEIQTRMIKNDKEQLAPEGAPKDMGFKNKSDDYEEGVVDYETGLLSSPLEERKAKDKAQREAIKTNLLLVEEQRGLRYTPKALNIDIKIYQQLIAAGWSDEGIIEEYLNIINSDFWKEKRKQGSFPGLNTVEFSLRNKQPK